MSDLVPDRLPRAVAIGGGHGQARTLQALAMIADHVTAIVTVADDGGSSGRLREQLGVLPPGDLRMAIAALSPSQRVADLLDHRFAAGDLAGHAVGNVVLLAMADLEGGMVAGLRSLLDLLGCPHDVLPSTEARVQLQARVGTEVVTGQARIAATAGVTDLALVGEPPVAVPEAVAAIEQADLIVLGPGSVCTSVVPNLLVPEIGAAVGRATAPRVLVGNLDEQKGEGEGRSLADHVRLLTDVVPDLIVDHVVAHDGPAPATGRPALRVDDELAQMVGRVRAADLLVRGPGGGHDPAVLAEVLHTLVS